MPLRLGILDQASCLGKMPLCSNLKTSPLFLVQRRYVSALMPKKLPLSCTLSCKWLWLSPAGEWSRSDKFHSPCAKPVSICISTTLLHPFSPQTILTSDPSLIIFYVHGREPPSPEPLVAGKSRRQEGKKRIDIGVVILFFGSPEIAPASGLSLLGLPLHPLLETVTTNWWKVVAITGEESRSCCVERKKKNAANETTESSSPA